MLIKRNQKIYCRQPKQILSYLTGHTSWNFATDLGQDHLIKDNITIDTIKVEIDGSTLQNTDMEFFNFMHEILNNYEIGKYEFGNIKINIYNKKTLNNIICNNPKFNKNILIIE